MKKKLMAVLLSAVLAASMLTACGSSSSSDTSDDTTEEAAEEEEEEAEEAEEETEEVTEEAEETEEEEAEEVDSDDIGEPNGGATVTMWHYFETEADALNAAIKEYNEMQDEIYIVPTYVSREELMKQYTIGAVSGELPDIGMVDSPDMASYISLGVFANLDEYLLDWEDLDQFYEGPLSSCMGSDGSLYGLPNNSNCLALLVNMDMLREAGIEEAPTTWEEFEAACAAVSDPDNGVYGFAMSAVSNEEGTFQFIPWLYGAGGTIADITSDESVYAFEFIGSLIENGYMSEEAVNWGQGDALNAWAAGKAAMVESGTWQIAQNLDNEESIKNDVTWEYVYVEMPSYNGNQASVIGGENFGVCATSDYIEECAEFLKYLMSAENNAEWCEIAGKIPVRADSVELSDFWTSDERYVVFTDSMDFAVARGPHAQWPTISEALYTAEQSVILGTATAEEAAAAAAAVIDPILEEDPLP